MIAIIPARGGSKRIPRKNIKSFHGKPIIAYAIENALNSGIFDEVFVSTDDEEIATIARNYGASVPVLRSEKNSDDHTTTFDVLIEVANYFLSIGKKIEQACCIYPTTPLLSSENLTDGFQIFSKSEFDVLLSSVEFESHIQRGFTLGKSNEVQLLQPDYILKRSQDIPASFHDAGAFYFFNVDSLKNNGSLWKGKVGGFQLPTERVQDIDTPNDWKMAELKYELLK